MTHDARFWLNLTAILFLGIGALMSLIPALMVPEMLRGLLWGGLIAWVASARLNGQSSPSP